ncbi:Hypothetical predicted protein [Cloeon dipterum]|uniref:Uncharacterized protein n=1 Tax=Cloeon dipterum TaxID=197152 RepID=A0A8S1DK51_9INSE|nr:Hypothetical predicted protein [Cloeon dipterum]
MPTWLDYHTELSPSDRNDAVYCGYDTKRNLGIYVARTLYEGYYVPGYAVDGIGYFVSHKDDKPQQFQTTIFQVLVTSFLEFLDFETYYGAGIVADDEADISRRIRFGSFFIEGVRYCGRIDNQNKCHINCGNQVVSKEAPEFEVPLIEITLSSCEESDSCSSSNDSEDTENPSSSETDSDVETDSHVSSSSDDDDEDAENHSSSETDNDVKTDYHIISSSDVDAENHSNSDTDTATEPDSPVMFF